MLGKLPYRKSKPGLLGAARLRGNRRPALVSCRPSSPAPACANSLGFSGFRSVRCFSGSKSSKARSVRRSSRREAAQATSNDVPGLAPFRARPASGMKKAAVSRRRPFRRPSGRSPAAVVHVTAVVVMARATEAVVAVPMTTVTHVAAVVTAIAAVLRLLDHIASGCGRLGLDRERGSLRSARRRSEAQAGDRNRQCGDLDQGLSCASQHYRKLHLHSGNGAANRGSKRRPGDETPRGRRTIPIISRLAGCWRSLGAE